VRVIRKNKRIKNEKRKFNSLPPKNSKGVINEKKITKPYSPTNKSANPLLENSVLNPLTNSLSPSIKSNGARPVSAKMLILQINKIGKVNPKNLVLKISNKLIKRELIKKKILKRIKTRDSS
jgi:hypothetical protein